VAIGSIIIMSSLFTQVVSAYQIDTTDTTDVLIKKNIEKRKAHRSVSASGANAVTLMVYPEDDLSIIVLTNLIGALSKQKPIHRSKNNKYKTYSEKRYGSFYIFKLPSNDSAFDMYLLC